MNPTQILNIFRKDAHHLWPELTLHAAMLAAFAWITPLTWPGRVGITGPTTVVLTIVLALLHILIPIVWIVLIAKLIQDESLVGDQQFWITRPYNWPSLLISKLLFLIVCVMLPFLIMQASLLALAGIHTAAVLPAMFTNLGYIALIYFLPFILIAAITSTFGRFALGVVIAILYLIVLAVLIATTIIPALGPRVLPDNFEIFSFVLLAVLMLAALIYQYATRRALYSRIALIAAPLLLILTIFIPAGPFFAATYPVAKEADAPKLTFNADPAYQQPGEGKVFVFEGANQLAVPLTPADPLAMLPIEPKGATYTIDSVGGAGSTHFQSPWQSIFLQRQGLILQVPTAQTARFKGQHVHLHITVAGEKTTPGTPQEITTAPRFDLPGGGTCMFIPNADGNYDTPPVCHFAYVNPHAVSLNTVPYPDPCTAAASQPLPATAEPQGTVSAFFPAGSQSATLDPVVQQPMNFASPMAQPGTPQPTVCPGAKLQVTTQQAGTRMEFTIDIPDMPIDNYLRHQPPIPPGALRRRQP